ncbi:hypothetical protein JTB14_017923 [Gonioctena quinquepunctata]|nr:hypothetical protein JTB14_017923 [Gonioctena quinquepunctata]
MSSNFYRQVVLPHTYGTTSEEYTTEQNLEKIKENNERLRNKFPQRTMDVDENRIKYTCQIVKEADINRIQKNAEKLQKQQMIEFKSVYTYPNSDNNFAEKDKQDEIDKSLSCSSEVAMETDQIIEKALIHADNDMRSHEGNKGT